jgi:hypothetical protein
MRLEAFVNDFSADKIEYVTQRYTLQWEAVQQRSHLHESKCNLRINERYKVILQQFRSDLRFELYLIIK